MCSHRVASGRILKRDACRLDSLEAQILEVSLMASVQKRRIQTLENPYALLIGQGLFLCGKSIYTMSQVHFRNEAGAVDLFL